MRARQQYRIAHYGMALPSTNAARSRSHGFRGRRHPHRLGLLAQPPGSVQARESLPPRPGVLPVGQVRPRPLGVYRQAFSSLFTTREAVAGRILGDMHREAFAQLGGVDLADVT